MENLTGEILKTSIVSAQRTTGSAVIAGAAIDITGVNMIKHFILASAVAAGTNGIQDIQFANDSSFTVNVDTYTSDNYLNKNNNFSSSSAIAQTVLSAAGSKSIAHKNLAKNGQKFMRVRMVASSGSPDVTAEVKTLLLYLDQPQVQA
jgi:hypothetical protein